MNAITRSRIAPGDSRLSARLKRETEGEVLFGAGDRGRYATDASIYQVEPIGVLVPRDGRGRGDRAWPSAARRACPSCRAAAAPASAARR